MTEPERIADQLRRAFEGSPWYGPGVREILHGVTEEQALARPIAGAHTICELVHHMAAWTSFIVDRLNGMTREVSPEENFPANADWRSALDRLERMQADLLRAIAALDPARLDERLYKEYSIYVALHGVIQHDIYHAGQIQMLKRALA